MIIVGVLISDCLSFL